VTGLTAMLIMVTHDLTDLCPKSIRRFRVTSPADGEVANLLRTC